MANYFSISVLVNMGIKIKRFELELELDKHNVLCLMATSGEAVT